MQPQPIIALAADHRGFALKQQLHAWLSAQGYELRDFGAAELTAEDDYVDYAVPAAEFVAADPAHRRGIFLCGNGQGMAMVANKRSGVRAFLVDHPGEFFMDEAAPVLVLAAEYLNYAEATAAIERWLAILAEPLAERHQRRIEKIMAMEH